MKIKIAACQFKIKQFLPKYNLKRIEKFIKTASKKNVDIIVFPEDFLTGPICGKLEFADSQRKYIKIFKNLAKKYKISIIPGSIIEKEKTGIFNKTYFVEKNGKVKGEYRKINLWHPERRYLTPGNKISVFNTKYGKIGLIICWDLMFPEIFRKMVKLGAKIIFCPSYWLYEDAGKGIAYDKNSEARLIDSLSQARAFENEIIFVFCNAVGTFIFKNFKAELVGHCQITAPFKGVVKKLNHNKEELLIQDIDLKILNIAEKVYKIRKDLKHKFNI